VGSDSKNGVRHQRALSPRLSMMMMMNFWRERIRNSAKSRVAAKCDGLGECVCVCITGLIFVPNTAGSRSRLDRLGVWLRNF